MALGLPESLWRGELRQTAPPRRKAVDKMVRLNIPLDPGKTGRDATQLETGLHRMIVGQDEAIQQIVNIYQMHLTGMNPPGRPIGNFLFLGPTGSGKTRIVEATAEVLLKNPRSVIKIDCAEFQHSHEIAKLIGSPPGYLGHRETHPLLSQEVLNQHHTENIKLSGAHKTIPKRAYVHGTVLPRESPFKPFYERTKADPAWHVSALACGHHVMLDEPDRVAGVLESLL